MGKPNCFVDEYEGRPIFHIELKDGHTFRFGVGKAVSLLACIEEVQKFVDDNRNKKPHEARHDTRRTDSNGSPGSRKPGSDRGARSDGPYTLYE